MEDAQQNTQHDSIVKAVEWQYIQHASILLSLLALQHFHLIYQSWATPQSMTS